MKNFSANNFDAIRLIAAWLVFVSHMFAILGLPEPGFFGLQSLGGIGVMIFFSVSGYLVAESWRRDPDWQRFLLRRMLRVFPGYATAIIFCAVIIAPFFHAGAWYSWYLETAFWKYISNLFIFRPHYHPSVFDGHPYSALNGSLWSIPIEVWCYVFLMLSWLLFKDAFRMVGLLVFLVVSSVYLYLGGYSRISEGQFMNGWFFAAMLAVFFLAGALFSLWPVWKKSRVFAVFLMLASLLLLWQGEALFGLLLALPWIVIATGEASWPFVRRVGQWGDYSYGVYLYAWPMQQLSVAILGKEAPLLAHFLLAGCLTWLAAFVSWHAVEKKSLIYKRLIVAGRKPYVLDKPAVVGVLENNVGG